MKIKLISTELIKPSSPTPLNCREYKLSFIDERIPHSYIPLILYYPPPTNFKNHSEISKCLKESLSETLSQFYPMAGRNKDQASSIDCNDEGVFYSESQVDGDLSELVSRTDFRIIDQLIPCRSVGCLVSADELMAIQLNFFNCGGIAIGICQSHRIADGCTLCSFVLAWAAKAAAVAATASPVPLFNSASLFPPRNSLDFKPDPNSKGLQPPPEKVETKRFIFTSDAIELLKSRVIANRSPGSTGTENPTRVQVVSGYIWKCCMVTKGLGKDDESAAFHPVNLRRRSDPPLPDSLFGNVFQMAYAVASGGDDWVALAGITRSAIGKMDRNFCSKLLGENGYEFAKSNFDEFRKYLNDDLHIVRFSSWCGFPLYDADFGWGSPIWLGSTSYPVKNIAFVFDSKSSGGIEAWITMAENVMPRFVEEMYSVAIIT